MIAQSCWATARVAEGLIKGEGHGDCAVENITSSDCLDKEADSLRRPLRQSNRVGTGRFLLGKTRASARLADGRIGYLSGAMLELTCRKSRALS
ncbi:hypothetical protein BK634_12595 [Pseudomonas chlororaphis]|nr:hypothetical protein BK634_12595 [Pseudomonas chlororaphis]